MRNARHQVLVIDDLEGLIGIFQVLFDADRIELTQALTGQEGLDRLRRQKFDLVILDLGLPDVNGDEVLREIKCDKHLSFLPVIVLTGLDRLEEKVRLFDLGATDYVTKPFHPTELRARVRAVLRALEAEETVRIRTMFMAQMSHEIRNPLSGVIAGAELLMDSTLDEQQQQLAHTIRQSGETCLHLVNDVLEYSRLEAGRMEVAFDPFNLRGCVEMVFDLVAARAAEKDIDLVCRFAPGTCETILGDRKRLQQVLVNLVGNAVKFTRRGEIVVDIKVLEDWDEISIAEPSEARPTNLPRGLPDSHYLVRIRDTGIGIAPQAMGRLFEAYNQLGAATRRAGEGSGLGLAISKKLVEMLGGAIWAGSVLGQGSCFSFYWPVSYPMPYEVQKVIASEDDTTFRSQQISSDARLATPSGGVLIIEDGSAAREFLETETRRMGMDPVTFANTTEALASIAASRSSTRGKDLPPSSPPNIRVAIVDERLGDLPQLVPDIRRICGNPQLPVALLTSLNADLRKTVNPPPPFVRIYKPLKRVALQRCLARLLAQDATAPATYQHLQTPILDGGLGQLYPLSILLVEDNLISQRVGLSLLKRLGYAADVASDGGEALAALKNKGYDLLFLDVQMPVLDGLETARRIRRQEQEARPGKPDGNGWPLPVVLIAMTANVMLGDADAIVQAGMNDCLPKPVEPRVFQTVLARWARRVHAARKEGRLDPWPVEVVMRDTGSFAGDTTFMTRDSDWRTPGPEKRVVDMERFQELAGPSAEGGRELKALFLDRTLALINQLDKALQSGNLAEVRHLAHSGAGSSGTCGVYILADLFAEIMRLCDNENLSGAKALVAAARSEWERAAQFLSKHYEASK